MTHWIKNNELAFNGKMYTIDSNLWTSITILGNDVFINGELAQG